MKENLPINIVEDIWTYLSPFSAHQIKIWGETFPTVEHAYQWSKFESEEIKNEIINAVSPLGAWRVANKYKPDTKKDFDKDSVMEELFRAKAAQHSDIIEVLKLSNERGILKIFGTDYYWGTGADGSGQNKMGKLWMKIRSEMV